MPSPSPSEPRVDSGPLKLEAAFMDPVGGTPAELARFMRDELERWTPAIRRSGAMEQ
jgi:hypothetical protein